MRYGTPFLVADALRRSARRPGGLVVWALAVAAVLVSGTALFLIPIASGAPGATSVGYLVAQLSPTPSEAAIARLGSEIWTWPGVDAVAFRFPGESDPVPIAQRALLIRLHTPEVRSAVESRLRALTEIVGVQYHQQSAGRTRVPSAWRIGAVVALVATLSLAVWLGYRGTSQAAVAWGRELALLRSCGASPVMQRAPFLALGAVIGLAGGGLYVGACWSLWTWGRSLSFLRDVVPSFPHVWGGLVVWGAAIGVGLGLAGSLVATLAPPPHS